MSDPQKKMRARMVKIARISRVFSYASRPVKVGNHILSCRSPIANDGVIDHNYVIVSVSGFESCDLWIFKGSVNLATTLQDFDLSGLQGAQIDELETIYIRAAVKVLLRPSTYTNMIPKVLSGLNR